MQVEIVVMYGVFVVIALLYLFGLLWKHTKINNKMEEVQPYVLASVFSEEAAIIARTLMGEIRRMQKHPFRPW